MNNLTKNDIDYIKNKIEEIKTSLNAKTINDNREANIALETTLTLNAIETCLATHKTPAALTNALNRLLTERWDRIRKTAWNYTQMPADPVNQLCLSIATFLAPLPKKKEELNQLGPEVGPYFLLMPSLKAWKDYAGTNIHNFALHQFVLSDQQNLFIPIESCLENALESNIDRGILKHMVSDPEGRYALKLMYLQNDADLKDNDIPERTLCVYLRNGEIHCAAKNKPRFRLTEEQFIEEFKKKFEEELHEEEPLNIIEICQKKYAGVKQALALPQKKSLKIFINRATGEIFCRYQKPNVIGPVKIMLDPQRLGEHYAVIRKMLDNPQGLQPILTMQEDGALTCAVQEEDGELRQVLLEDEALGESAVAIREALQQPAANKAFTMEEEGVFFRLVADKGYQRENQDFSNLSADEIDRVANHSQITKNYHNFIRRIHRPNGSISLGAALWNLYIALGRGAHKAGDANQKANEGIGVFSEIWDTYSEMEKMALYARYPRLSFIIKALRPEAKNFENCIGMTAETIHSFLKKNPTLYQDNELLKKQHKLQLEKCIAKGNYVVLDNSVEEGLTLPTASLDNHFFNSIYVKQALRYAIEHQHKLSDDLLKIILSFNDPEKQTLLRLTNHQGNNVLIRAATCQSMDLLSGIIKSTPKEQINAHNKRGETALMATVFNQQSGAAAAQLLIRAGASIHMTNRFGQTAITLAVRHQNLEVLNVLIKHSNDPTLTRQQALRYAIAINSPMLETLLFEVASLPLDQQKQVFDRLLPPTEKGCEAATVLMYAVLTQHPMLNALLKQTKKPILNAKNDNGDTALILAAQHNLSGQVTQLIGAGVDINASNAVGATAYSIAFANHYLTITPSLIEHPDLSISPVQVPKLPEKRISQYSDTSMHLCKFIMDKNADLTVEDQSLLVKNLNAACKKGSRDSNQCQAMLRYAAAHSNHLLLGLTGADQLPLLSMLFTNLGEMDDVQVQETLLNARDSITEDTPLMKATRAGNIAAVRILKEAGADLDAINSAGENALTIAIQSQNKDMINDLLSSDIDIRPTKRNNAFSLALEQKPFPESLIDDLLIIAVSLNLADQKQLLVETSHEHILDYVFNQKPALLPKILERIALIEDTAIKHAILNARDKHGNTIVHLAIKETLDTGNIAILNLLIDNGSHIDMLNMRGDSPLSYAIQYPLNNEAYNVVELLLEKEANIYQRDCNGKNALDYATTLKVDKRIISALLSKANQSSPEKQAELLQETSCCACILVYALDNYPSDYITLLPQASPEQRNRLEKGLEALIRLDFNNYLSQIEAKAIELQTRWFFPTQKNRAAIKAANLLYESLKLARIAFLQSDDPLEQKMQAFKANCLQAINLAEPILKPHRGIKAVIDALKNALNIRLIIQDRIQSGKWNFFQSETESARIVRGLKDKLLKPDDEAPVGGLIE